MLLSQWPLIEADLHQVYGIDASPELFAGRPSSWIQNRISALLSCDSRLSRFIQDRNQTKK